MTQEPKQLKQPKLSLGQARRIALAAQGFAQPRPSGRVDKRHLRKAIDRMGLIQVDSVNVFVRSEELPLFARIGPYPRHLLREMDNDGELFEYWVHEASLLPAWMEPLTRWKKQSALDGSDPSVWGGLRGFHHKNPEVVATVFDEIAARGPVRPSELSMAGGKNRDGWGWHWDTAKLAVENLFWTGRVAAAHRSSGFERAYDLPERCFAPHILSLPTPSEHEARKEMLRIAARAHGIGTAKCLADYHRQKLPIVRPLLAELVEEGALTIVDVEGWGKGLYLDAEAKMPRVVSARALLSPFDPVVWERTRAEQLFGFRYRIEIYVPKEKRIHGYYVLPFLLGDQLVGRVDLKSDRARSTLLVQSAWGELGIDEHEVARELAEELRLIANWLGLESVEVVRRGDLASALGREFRERGTPRTG